MYIISTREVHTISTVIRLVSYSGSWSHQLSTRPVSFLSGIGVNRVMILSFGPYTPNLPSANSFPELPGQLSHAHHGTLIVGFTHGDAVV